MSRAARTGSIEGDVKRKHFASRQEGAVSLASSPCRYHTARWAAGFAFARALGSKCMVARFVSVNAEHLPAARWPIVANQGSIGDSRPIAFLGCPRGHTVARETLRLTRPRILTLEPVRSARKPTPVGPGLLECARKAYAACGFSCWASNDSPFFQICKAIAAILRASVSRAIAGMRPFASSPW